MKVINRITNEVIGEIVTNHSMTLDEALEILADEYDCEIGCYIKDGEEISPEDCEIVWDEDEE